MGRHWRASSCSAALWRTGSPMRAGSSRSTMPPNACSPSAISPGVIPMPVSSSPGGSGALLEEGPGEAAILKPHLDMLGLHAGPGAVRARLAQYVRKCPVHQGAAAAEAVASGTCWSPPRSTCRARWGCSARRGSTSWPHPVDYPHRGFDRISPAAFRGASRRTAPHRLAVREWIGLVAARLLGHSEVLLARAVNRRSFLAWAGRCGTRP